MTKEAKFFQNELPETIDCGLILVDLKEIKKIYYDLIDSYLDNLKKAIYEKFCQILSENEKIVTKILDSLEKIPSNVEEYISISQHIRSQEFKSNLQKVKSDFKTIQIIQEMMNNFLIFYDEFLLQIYVESCVWVKRIKNKRNKTKMKLVEMRPKFKNVMEERKKDLLSTFDQILEEIEPLKNNNDYSNAYGHANSSKNIFTQLNSLVDKANLLNNQEKFLNYQQTNFESIEKL